ncbi:MAG TPA: IMP cyclohydrolase [Desulfovibrio sp.]|mgnify:CR=1 FL=1|jgi:phosphoribosylaminoimidazolecarboxamide formyltransferase/IMP cyclohydrolase|uniref:IMP cyclohydrolase n=1 Tax=Desulfovibrio TaxID=872 RepID=UPI0004121922|nr:MULTISPECIES: IMP cyclohydrolase [Desulfovibrio]MDY0306973.1 IMP cyclohydrolase [Desulfovibrionaceae bacterium]HMM38952.1 IMP cyclohydrolase [Desulfovibrio sp.]
MDFLVPRRAILSVTDKTGLVDFARALNEKGVELVSTGGTMKAVREAGLPVTSVSDVTGFPEILGGRVKTLHPHVHAGVLADKDDPAHMATLDELKIKPFDLICVNLYNFAEAARKGLDLRAAVEQIDIGGPTLLRASAKNFHSILVVPGVAHYGRVLTELAERGGFSLPLRKDMAAETFRLVSAYDAMIADYLSGHRA